MKYLMILASCIIIGCGKEALKPVDVPATKSAIALNYTNASPQVVDTLFDYDTFTITATFSTDNETPYARIAEIGGYQSTGGGVSLEVKSNLGLTCILWDASGEAVLAQVGVPDGVDLVSTTVECKFNGGLLTLKKDGVLVDSLTTTYIPAQDSGIGVGRAAHYTYESKDFAGQITSLSVSR